MDTQNLRAFRDEGLVYTFVLSNSVLHSGQQPPQQLNELTQDWLEREELLYLGVRNAERAGIARLYAALKAQGINPEEAGDRVVGMVKNGKVDLFAAVVPSSVKLALYEELASVFNQTAGAGTVEKYTKISTTATGVKG